jgi:hypothetical protein
VAVFGLHWDMLGFLVRKSSTGVFSISMVVLYGFMLWPWEKPGTIWHPELQMAGTFVRPSGIWQTEVLSYLYFYHKTYA